MTEKKNIEVQVKFFANLREIAPPKKNVTLPEGSMVSAILELFKISKDTNLIILINGSPHQTRETVVNDGDIVAVFPPLAGG